MTEVRHAVILETVIVEEQTSFTLAELCHACGTPQEHLQGLVEEGVLQPAGADPRSWHFDGEHLRVARSATRLARDFELNAQSTALVLELLHQIHQLRAQMKQAGIA